MAGRIALALGLGALFAVAAVVVLKDEPPAPRPRPAAITPPPPRAPLPPAPPPPPPPAARSTASTCPPEMVLIPGATFTMGLPPGADDLFDDERPSYGERVVTLGPYCIDRTEVTVAAYAACKQCPPLGTHVHWDPMSAADAKELSDRKLCNGYRPDRQEHPVNCVSWYQATEYCHAVGKELPTEARWELAARGTDGRLYPWGNQRPTAKRLNACGPDCDALSNSFGQKHGVLYRGDDGYVTTAPVGSYPAGASPFGVLDLAGNVQEWTADEHVDYAPGTFTDPPPVTTSDIGRNKSYVVRGSSWDDSLVQHIRATRRIDMGPTARFEVFGFRCARDPR